MKPSPESEKNLERCVSAALRDLPSRRAPRALQSRVLAELERRAALPWWRKSFAHWPMAMRGVFLVTSAALAVALVWALAGINTTQAVKIVAADFAWLQTVRNLGESVVSFGAIMIRGIPAVWLYGGAIAFVSLYAALFGLGTAAYRTLYANR
jgi:hypothetical protein